MSYYVVSVDASSGLLVEEGERVEQGQPIGRCRTHERMELAPAAGTVRFVQFDAASDSLVVYIRPERARSGRPARGARPLAQAG